MSRKNENHIRRRFYIIILRTIKSIQEATNNDNIKVISDVDRRFVDEVINSCTEQLYDLGKQTFNLNLL